MSKNKNRYVRSIMFVLVIASILTIIASAIFVSSFLAILGTSCIFWCGVLFFITPERHVPLPLINASTVAGTNNIERILTEENFNQKGIYLPPKCLKDSESSLVFVPKFSGQELPLPEEIEVSGLFNSKQNLFLTPPGGALLRIFEKHIGYSFIKVDLSKLQSVLLKVMIEDMRLADDVVVTVGVDTVVFEVKNSIFVDDCQRSRAEFPCAHGVVSSLLSSCFACVLAKVTGRGIVVLDEVVSGGVLRLEYQMVGA
ncbi:MAG: hypothetical protein LBH62_09165 [Nitrososphaerota archaeon]|nr:hypothetical protein [Nitrososphaerota archaeon]